MPRRPIRSSALAAVLALALTAPTAAAGRALPGTPVPSGFVGVNLDGPLTTSTDHVSLPSQFNQMARNGVESVRLVFNWSGAQPYASWSDVPADQTDRFQSGASGVPTDFSATDQFVQQAAENHMTVLPTVLFTPRWDARPQVGTDVLVPKSDQPYADYLTTLVERYGPSGSFWTEHPNIPKLPIRMWEIWNEPWLSYYWSPQPWTHGYIALLRAARAAIKSADPGAKVVLAGMPNASWADLQAVYRVRGARGLFDVVDVHPYTKYPAGDIQILSLVRQVMNRAGDRRKPMIAGELGWLSALHQTQNVFDWETTAAGQAQAISAVLPLLAANRAKLDLIGFDWYTWMGDQYRGGSPWGFAGLLGWHNGNVFTKPALSAFRQRALALEH
jgi:hypothetical protein